LNLQRIIDALVPLLTLFHSFGGNYRKLTEVLDLADAEGRPVSAEELTALREDAGAALDRADAAAADQEG
jgi:hypothetical protein